MRKTDRVYGAVVNSIREVARNGLPFTRLDVPATADIRHRRLFALMVKSGELRRLKQGSGAREPSVYQIAT
jgi:hypothetical protein